MTKALTALLFAGSLVAASGASAGGVVAGDTITVVDTQGTNVPCDTACQIALGAGATLGLVLLMNGDGTTTTTTTR